LDHDQKELKTMSKRSCQLRAKGVANQEQKELLTRSKRNCQLGTRRITN
jgi:hypothetical protein